MVKNSSNFFLFTISQILLLCKASPKTDNILSKDVIKYGSKLFLHNKALQLFLWCLSFCPPVGPILNHRNLTAKCYINLQYACFVTRFFSSESKLYGYNADSSKICGIWSYVKHHSNLPTLVLFAQDSCHDRSYTRS